MSIAEKLANRDIVRLKRMYSALKARDWVDGAMYDEEKNISMDEWIEMVRRELQTRTKKVKVIA